MPRFSREQIEKALEVKSSALTPEDVRRIASNRDAVMKMIGEFPSDAQKAQRQAKLLFELIRDASTGKLDLHPDELRYAAGALIYLGAALDLIPDDEKDGYTDDAAVIALAIQKTEAQVRAYCKSAGLDVLEYLD